MIIRLIKKIYRYVPAGVPSALVVTLILYLTLAPQPLGDDAPQLFEGVDKVVHAIMFGAMSFTIALDRLMGQGRVTSRALVTIAAVTVATGVAIEFLQGAMDAGRSGDAADAIADTAGALAGIWLFTLVRKGLEKAD